MVLLQVYGDGGWVFIEEASYLLLINILLKKQNDDEEKVNLYFMLLFAIFIFVL